MATRTINPQSNPYGGGAVIFDSTPYVEYYLKEQQKEDAKNEAIDKYYQEEISKISPAGMRSEDLPVFTNKYNQLKKMWVENKEAIKNPAKYGFEKAQQYNQLKADLISMPIESKEEKEREATVLKLLADPSKRELIDIPTLSESMRIQKMPIRSEGRQSIDLANLPFVSKEMTPQEKMAYQKSILSLAGKDKTVGQPIKIGKFEEKVTEIEKFSDDNLRKLGEIARKDALTNKNLQRTAKLDFERITPEMKLELNALHNQIYGRPIQAAEDLAAASIIQAGRLAKKEEEKTQRDIDALEKKKDQRAATMAAAKNAEPQYNPEIHLESIYESGSKDPMTYTLKGNKIQGREVSIPDELQDKYFDKVSGIVRRPDKVIMTDDKKKMYLIKFTGEVTKSGNPVINSSATRVVDVGSDLIPALAKTYGGVPFTRSNIFTGRQQSAVPQKNTKFVFPNGTPKKF